MATPINPVTAPHVYVPMQRQKSEREVMAANGGHVYYEVHLAHCAECREVEKKRGDENAFVFLWLIKIVVLTIVVCFAAYHFKAIKDWFAKMKKKLIMSKKEFEVLDRLCFPWPDWQSPAPEDGPSRLTWRHKIMVERLELIGGDKNIGNIISNYGFRFLPEHFILLNTDTNAAHYVHFTHDRSSCKVEAFLIPQEMMPNILKRWESRRPYGYSQSCGYHEYK
jgi:hypothetical protein